MFTREWRHPNQKAKLLSVSIIKNAKEPRFTQIRFHGTQRACTIGNNPLQTCDESECYLCQVLKNGFSIQHSNPKSMFGPGIYTSVVSSKANIYARNYHIRSHKHVLLICAIDPGNSRTMRVAAAPGAGVDSIEGATKPEGGTLEYPETVVFNEKNIKPVGLVVYTREGWQPR
ncbi:hypothetical protein FE257_004242 [Aspergillus nanangensis]|uniref:PARP catalytic domain-containing protein n=1 Tax=Aspergillus nanangensis TaxID=2582783 RepID=A0AAD4GW17_ASPNN|nr:hypothetical protein FE257_004242 [Aspergillus nanangensis]